MTKIERLKRRPDFLAVAGQRRKYVAPGLILQAYRRAASRAYTYSRQFGLGVAGNPHFWRWLASNLSGNGRRNYTSNWSGSPMESRKSLPPISRKSLS